MTSIGFRTSGALVPRVLPRPPVDGRRTKQLSPPPSAAARAVPVPAATWVRVGKVRARSAARYLLVWTGGLFVVQLVVLVAAYIVLWSLGVTGSVSRALAVINDEPLPASGVLPLLQPAHVLPVLALISLLMSLLFLVAAAGVVLVHNATTALTGGITVRVRPEPSRR